MESKKNSSSRTTVREKPDASIIEKYIRNDLTGTTFPIKLHIVLKVLHNEGSEDIISWMPHGRSFKIHNMHVFEQSIMKRFFRQSKIASFRRQLNLYGFQRVHYGRDIRSYYHRYFLRGKPQLAKHIIRESCAMQIYNHQRRQHGATNATDTPERQGMVGGTRNALDLYRSQDFYDMPCMGSVNDITMIDHAALGSVINASSSRISLRRGNEGGMGIVGGQSNVSNMNNHASMVGHQSVRTTDLMNNYRDSHQVFLQSPVGSCNTSTELLTLIQQQQQQQQVQEQVQEQVQVQQDRSTSALHAGCSLPTRSLITLSNNTSNTPILNSIRTQEGDEASFSSLPLLSAERVPAIALAVALSSSLSSLQGAVSSSSVSDQSMQQQQYNQQQQLSRQRQQAMLHHIELPMMMSQDVPSIITNAHDNNHRRRETEPQEGSSGDQSPGE